MELAFQMQLQATDAFDVTREADGVRDEYGHTPFGRSCLLARRLVERGVRFVQVYYVSKNEKQPWDTHRTTTSGIANCAPTATGRLLHCSPI